MSAGTENGEWSRDQVADVPEAVSKVPEEDVEVSERGAGYPRVEIEVKTEQMSDSDSDDDFESSGGGVSFSGRIYMDEHIPLWLLLVLMGTTYAFSFPFNILVINHLPYPKLANQSMLGDFAEESARLHLEDLVNVGARPAGSFENDIYAMKYVQDTVKQIQASTKTNKTIEIDVQRPTGSFFMPFLDDFTNYYANVTNTVVRLSSPESDQNALLLNCHTDTVINSPGASDDGVACAILLEVIRAIAAEDTPLHSPLIVLFNGAEENILQGSHGFITQHKWAEQVKAFINLEAAGAGGKEFIFQVGPENPWLVWTWAKHAPYPSGTSLGQDLFQSGVIPADTDFRVFRDHGNIPGIDLAYVRNGYVYHTLHDSPAMIQPGSIQRAGENILAVVRHLVQSPDSLLPDPSAYRHGNAAYYDIFGAFLLVIPQRINLIINYLTFVVVFLRIFYRLRDPITTGYTVGEYFKTFFYATVVSVAGYFLCMLGVCSVAALLTVTGRSLSWYSIPQLAFFLYTPAGLLGYVFLHTYAEKRIFKRKQGDVSTVDQVFTDVLSVVWCCFIFALRNTGTSFLLAIPIATNIIFDKLNQLMERIGTWWSKLGSMMILMIWVFPSTFSIYQTLLAGPLIMGLAARAGSDTPPELLMVILYAFSFFLVFSMDVSSFLMAQSAKWFFITVTGLLCLALCISFSSLGFPYSADPKTPAPKRFYMQHTQRQFFDKNGILGHEDSGMFICHLDYLVKDHHLGPDVVMNADFHKCRGTYCEMPFLLPLQKMVGSVQYISVPSPDASVTTDLYPLEFKWKGETSPTEGRSQNLKMNFEVKGPPDMALHIAPFLNGSLIGWSFEADVKDARSKYSEEETYFILYGGGVEHPVWKFWLEFLVPDEQTEEQILEIALTAHYKPSGSVSKVNTQTEQLRSITSELHDWVAPMTWVSLYRNYRI